MITDFKLYEAKQVGILYHWTESLNSLINIIKEDKLCSMEYGYISFTRNKNLKFLDRPIRIIFDGNEMSNKFKFESYDYLLMKHKTITEFEERIKCKKDNCIYGIKKYIICVEISVNNQKTFAGKHINDFYNKAPEQFLNSIQELIPNVKINIIE